MTSDKATKAEVHYGPAKATSRERCGNCGHFIRPDACERVRGAINPGDWCELWQKKKHG